MSLLQKLAKEAETTFSKSMLDDSFSTSLKGLIEIVNNIQASDLNINPRTLSNDSNSKTIVPIIAIPIFLNDNFSIDVYVLQEGASLPIHDHPNMYSISKVIHGTLRITAFNLVSTPSDEAKVIPDDLESKTKNLKIDGDSLIPVELHMCKDFTSKDEASLLTPVVGNYHELRAVSGTAAFIDIISPVYGPERMCHRYSILETRGADSKTKMWLSELTDMSKFWFKVINYPVPKVTL